MIYIADVASTGSQHEQFNVSFVKLLQTDRPDKTFVYISDSTHSKVIKNRLEGVEFRDLDIYKGRGGIREFIRGYKQFRDLARVARTASQEGVSEIYVLLVHPLAHLLFKLLTRRRAVIRIVMHGELESVRFNKHFLNKIWGFFLKQALTIRSQNVQYIVLGQSIFQNLLKVLPSFSRQTRTVLDHPYPFSEKSAKVLTKKRIVFSSLGVATLSKDSQYLFNVAEQASKLGLSQQAKFNICGRVYRNMEPYLNEHVSYKENYQALSRDEFDILLNESHFAVFYYNNVHYSLCPSGAFWDAVNAEIPLLYVHNDYFDYYASVAGAIGVAFNTPEELNKYILDLIRNVSLDDAYNSYVENIRKLKYNYMNNNNLLKQLKNTA